MRIHLPILVAFETVAHEKFDVLPLRKSKGRVYPTSSTATSNGREKKDLSKSTTTNRRRPIWNRTLKRFGEAQKVIFSRLVARNNNSSRAMCLENVNWSPYLLYRVENMAGLVTKTILMTSIWKLCRRHSMRYLHYKGCLILMSCLSVTRCPHSVVPGLRGEKFSLSARSLLLYSGEGGGLNVRAYKIATTVSPEGHIIPPEGRIMHPKAK